MVISSVSPLPPISRDVSPRSTGKRYTVDGEDTLEEHLGHCCELVKASVIETLPVDRIAGLLLGGGYGRGEGGVLRSSHGEEPYNDLEFYIFVRGNRRLFEGRYREQLTQLSHNLSAVVHLEVEFKVLTFQELNRLPISMFFYDMVAGHKWLIGDDNLLVGCRHHRAAHLLPLSEATRLLMNRCSGLLFAHEHLATQPFGPENADFVRRNISKAQLALGDAVLAAFGRYHWSCRERHERLKRFTVALPWRRELLQLHRQGVDFKLHPFRSTESHARLASDLNDITRCACEVWLWLESRRLHQSFISTRHYATNALPKWPEACPLRNVLHNLKVFRRPVSGALRHPRERVLESLALLLWEPVALTDSAMRAFLSRNLAKHVGDRGSAVARYRDIWSLVS
jgi:hypothetical protein